MLVLVIISISLTVGICGQGAPPLAVTSSPNTFDPNCVDVLNNCWDMPESNCQAPYEQWAKDNCPNRCKYCNGPTTPKPECRNKLTDCEAYGKSVCTNPDYTKWVAENCRYYCRMCTQDELIRMDAMTTTTTTIPPSLCKDKVDCRAYGANACSDSFKAWSKDNCKNYCGYCRGPPTPPPACVDHIPTCSAYDAKTCTDPNYDLWVEDNCKKFCGRCGGSGGSSPGGGVPTPGNSGVPVPMTGRDLPVITYAPPTPPKPGRRNVKTALFKRQFHASHHHAGETAGCFDSNSSECKSDGNDLTSGFPGSEYKPRPTPDSNWDSKPSTEAPVTTKSTKATTIKDDKPSTTGTTTTISMPITSQTTEVLTTPSIDSTDGGSSATPEQSSPIAVTNTTTQPGTSAPSANTTTATIGSTMAAISSEAPTTQSQTGLTDTGTSSTIVTDQSTTDSPSTSTTTAPVAVTEVLTTTTTASQTSAPVVTSTIPAAVSSTEASTPSSTSPSTASTTTVVTTPEPTTTTTPTLPSTSAPTTSTAPTSTLPSTAAPTTQSSTPASTLPSTPAPTTQPSTPAPTTSTTPTSTLPPTAAPTTQSSPPTTTSSPTSTTVASTAATTTKPPVARQSTTLAVETSTIECKDTVDNCVGYGLRICNDTLYLPWAKAHCPAFCEFCVPPTLTPFKCENKIGNCRQFDSGDLCTNTEYFAWSRENCFAYCGYHPCGTTTQPSGPQSP